MEFSLPVPPSLKRGTFPFSFDRSQESALSREAAKRLKHSLEMAQGEAQIREASLALLRHSLRLGHRRLSLQRLEAAVNCGAELTREDLHKCVELALRVNDLHVHERLANLSRKLESARKGSAHA